MSIGVHHMPELPDHYGVRVVEKQLVDLLLAAYICTREQHGTTSYVHCCGLQSTYTSHIGCLVPPMSTTQQLQTHKNKMGINGPFEFPISPSLLKMVATTEMCELSLGPSMRTAPRMPLTWRLPPAYRPAWRFRKDGKNMQT